MNGRGPARMRRVAVFGAVAMLGVVVGAVGHAADTSSQPLTRADCGKAGMRWNEGANVCAEATSTAGQTQSSTAFAATNRTAPINRFDSADTSISVCTSSTTFVDLPDAARTFKLGGSVKEEVVVMFQGTFVLNTSSGGSPADSGVIQLKVDGVVQDGPPAIVYANHGGTHGFNFVTRVLTPGNHTARIQWRTDLGGSMCVGARSLVILHR